MTVTNRTTKNLSGSIAVDDTFQSIDAQAPERQGFAFQNKSSTNTMYLFFGPLASATEDDSIAVYPGQFLGANVPGVTPGDQVCVAGKANDKFYAARMG